MADAAAVGTLAGIPIPLWLQPFYFVFGLVALAARLWRARHGRARSTRCRGGGGTAQHRPRCYAHIHDVHSRSQPDPPVSVGVAHELTRGVQLLAAQCPQSLAEPALLTWPTAHWPENPAPTGRAHHLELHPALVLGSLLPDLTDSDVCHRPSVAPSDDERARS